MSVCLEFNEFPIDYDDDIEENEVTIVLLLRGNLFRCGQKEQDN